MTKRNWKDFRDDTHASRVEIGFEKSKLWKEAPAIFGEGYLEILGHPVMEAWEEPYMMKLAGIAASNGGTVLELGFGMGISAAYIQKLAPQLHIIVEANAEVANKAREFGEGYENAIRILEGFWEEVIDRVPDDSVDGILLDSYPLSESEIHDHQCRFFADAYRKLRSGGKLTYYSDEIDSFSRGHLEKLISAGFLTNNIGGEIVEVAPPEGCSYWKAKTIFAPIVKK